MPRLFESCFASVSPMAFRTCRDLPGCCHAHSNRRADTWSGNPCTTKTNCHGRPEQRVRWAPPCLRSPLCCCKRLFGSVSEKQDKSQRNFFILEYMYTDILTYCETNIGFMGMRGIKRTKQIAVKMRRSVAIRALFRFSTLRAHAVGFVTGQFTLNKRSFVSYHT